MTASNEDHRKALEVKIAESEAGIGRLEELIEQIGLPAASELKRRVDALKVEEKALKRNFKEVLEGRRDASDQLSKVEALLSHIEREESSVGHEADFLKQGPPSTVVMAAEAGARVVDKLGRGVKKATGNSVSERMVFVNHSHDTLVARYGLKDEGDS